MTTQTWQNDNVTIKLDLGSCLNRGKESVMLKKVEVFKENDFSDGAMKNFLVHESPYMKVINFNFRAGQELPIHSHDFEGQLSITVLEGKGKFLGDSGKELDANPGDVLISDISEPHGIRAVEDLRCWLRLRLRSRRSSDATGINK